MPVQSCYIYVLEQLVSPTDRLHRNIRLKRAAGGTYVEIANELHTTLNVVDYALRKDTKNQQRKLRTKISRA